MQKDTAQNASSSDASSTIENSLPSFFRVLKLLIAGSVDADRLDYTIRDGVESGSTIGQFDLNRVVESTVIFRDRSNPENHRFKLAFFHRATSGIEQFFVERYQGYKYLIYHRTSSRSEACVQELISRLLLLCQIDRSCELATLARSLGFIADEEIAQEHGSEVKPPKAPQMATQFFYPMHKEFLANFDDSAVRSLLIEIVRRFSDIEKSCNSISSKNLLMNIRDLARIVLYRDFRNIFDPFKRESMRRFIKRTSKNLTEHDVKNYFAKLITSDSELKEEISFAESFFESELGPEIIPIISTQPPKIYDHDRACKKNEDVLLAFPPTDLSPPPEDIDAGFSAKFDIQSAPVISASSALRTMPKIYVEELKIKIFFVSNLIKDNPAAQQKVNDAIIKYVSHLELKIGQKGD